MVWGIYDPAGAVAAAVAVVIYAAVSAYQMLKIADIVSYVENRIKKYEDSIMARLLEVEDIAGGGQTRKRGRPAKKKTVKKIQ